MWLWCPRCWQNQQGLVVAWTWGRKERIESKIMPGLRLGEKEDSISQDNARKHMAHQGGESPYSECVTRVANMSDFKCI